MSAWFIGSKSNSLMSRTSGRLRWTISAMTFAWVLLGVVRSVMSCAGVVSIQRGVEGAEADRVAVARAVVVVGASRARDHQPGEHSDERGDDAHTHESVSHVSPLYVVFPSASGAIVSGTLAAVVVPLVNQPRRPGDGERRRGHLGTQGCRCVTGLQCARPAGIPEWPKGAGCKPAGSAFGGSNPPPCIARGNPGFPREPPP